MQESFGVIGRYAECDIRFHNFFPRKESKEGLLAKCNHKPSFFHGLFAFFCLFFGFLGFLPGSAHLEEVMETFEEVTVKHHDEAVELGHRDGGASHTAEGANRVIVDAHDQGIRGGSLADPP